MSSQLPNIDDQLVTLTNPAREDLDGMDHARCAALHNYLIDYCLAADGRLNKASQGSQANYFSTFGDAAEAVRQRLHPSVADFLTAAHTPDAPLFYFVDGMPDPDWGNFNGLFANETADLEDEPEDSIVRLYSSHPDACGGKSGGGMLYHQRRHLACFFVHPDDTECAFPVNEHPQCWHPLETILSHWIALIRLGKVVASPNNEDPALYGSPKIWNWEWRPYSEGQVAGHAGAPQVDVSGWRSSFRGHWGEDDGHGVAFPSRVPPGVYSECVNRSEPEATEEGFRVLLPFGVYGARVSSGGGVRSMAADELFQHGFKPFGGDPNRPQRLERLLGHWAGLVERGVWAVGPCGVEGSIEVFGDAVVNWADYTIPLVKMQYCAECDRHFGTVESLEQHRRDSARHADAVHPYSSTTASLFGPTTVSSIFAPPATAHSVSQTTPSSAASEIAAPATQTATARDTAEYDTMDTIETIETSEILIDALRGLYTSGDYSDLVISCQGKEYKVHRAVVCTQSDFFSAACRGGFKEAQEGKIDLPDDSPRLVHIMVHYLYHFDYDAEMGGHEPDVEELAEGPLYTHARVYALAEKYLIHGLKAVALRQFKAVIASSFNMIDFLQAMEEVYMSTVEDDRGLRDVVVEAICKHPAWLDKEDVREVLGRLGSLTYDIVIHLRESGFFLN
ncbi:hypothetical protein F5144DRAFT_536893 [Chaetomium tenue]|uniref:Uncharacterized protein n=1 Tax=Chaetomium tenue TaxID=1854479 RepID=A0ACB7P8Z3_9PEZI|nr:hypothetical protein F5144DRAFT_536893 [Chaetomium globosum]